MLKSIFIFCFLILTTIAYTADFSKEIQRIDSLLLKHKVSQITIIDSSYIQILLHDTTINNSDFYNINISNPIDFAKEIEKSQIETFGKVLFKTEFMQVGKFPVYLNWFIPISILAFIFILIILSIIYFMKSNLPKGYKAILIGILILFPISVVIIYPLRRKIIKEKGA